MLYKICSFENVSFWKLSNLDVDCTDKQIHDKTDSMFCYRSVNRQVSGLTRPNFRNP